MEDTKDFPGLTVNLAINYGGKGEVCRAVNRWLGERVKEGSRGDNPGKSDDGNGPDTIHETDISRLLDVAEFPEADLIIRTGGECRMSNFLLWQGAYAELLFSDKLWPDWDAGDLQEALEEYRHRERRFGSA